MNVRALLLDPAEIDATWLAIGVFEDAPGLPNWVSGTASGALFERLVDSTDLGSGLGETTPVLGGSGLVAGAVLGVGLGPRSTFGTGAAFSAGVAVGRRLSSKPREKVAMVLPDSGDPAEIASALVEGILVGTRGAGLRKSEPTRHAFGELLLIGPKDLSIGLDQLDAATRRGVILGESVNMARDLVNTPPSEKPPAVLAARFKDLGEDAGVTVEVWDQARIRQERLGGLLGVSAGSDQPPAFVTMRYLRGGSAPGLTLVGKGVTFDSGGLSLKPSASMEDMKADMTGAAVVLATMCAVARLGLPVNLSGMVALTENMTGGRAMKLGDVLTMRNGKTVEVLNTDAEGRLILADALSLAIEEQPARVLDLATLTGACVVALGQKVAGLFSNDDPFAEAVLAASRRTGERSWRMPMDEDYDDLLKSAVADMKNVGGKWGGAISAAKFLQRFVGKTPWVHLDIAGPSWADSDSSTRDAGGTGCFVRTLVNLLESSDFSQRR